MPFPTKNFKQFKSILWPCCSSTVFLWSDLESMSFKLYILKMLVYLSKNSYAYPISKLGYPIFVDRYTSFRFDFNF